MQSDVSNIPPRKAATEKYDVLDIPARNATLESRRRWKLANLVLNVSRWIRDTSSSDKKSLHTSDHKKLCVRESAELFREGYLFKKIPTKKSKDDEVPREGFEVGPTTLATFVRERDIDALMQFGGVNGVANLLHTDLQRGIEGGPKDIQNRRNAYGENSYRQKAAHNFFVFVREASKDTKLIFLMVYSALLFFLGIKSELLQGIKEGWHDGVGIFIAVFLLVLFRAMSDYRKYFQFQNLNEEKRNIQLQVIRTGRRSKVSIFDLVVGDVVPLNIGDQVPADGILIEGHSLFIDESSMTGESKFVYKDKKNPFLISGCKVADGCGTMLVTAVGLNTEWGVMAVTSEDNGEETPLQVRVNSVVTIIGKVGLAVVVEVFCALMVKYFTGHTEDVDGKPMFIAGKTKGLDAFIKIVNMFAIMITTIVVAAPKGLPSAVTWILAYSMRKIMADKALLRRLSSCETMGSATTICSDKTGTLTLNQMTVVKVFIAGESREPPDSSESLPPVIQALLVEGISQNTTGSVYKCKGSGEMEVTGSPTEKAILSWALKLGMNFDDERSKSSVLHVLTFNSERKRGGVALKRSDTEVHIHWKAAAEIILDLCKTWIDSSGSLQEMTPIQVDKNKKIIEGMAAATLRCIAFAYRTCDLHNVPVDEEQRKSWKIPEDNLTLLAIVGIKDPCRPNVREAVNICQKAGVKVRMVTGDNIYTAKAIAIECGILQPGEATERYAIIEGRDFRSYSEDERLEFVDKICVMGRSSPTDKFFLVQALRKRGHVVAVTGDGTNDVPALREADIGLSMGIQGTEVAKESSDIIILDDNFASVLKVVWWGRSVYANIQKFIQFQLTVNVAALVIICVAAFSSEDVPLTAVQLLWVNLIMDTLGAFALATEAPTDHLMIRPPIGRREPLITNVMWRNLIVQAFYQVIVLLVLTFKGNDILDLKLDKTASANKVKNTVIFNAFVFCQIFNGFNSRKPDQINIFRGLLSSYFNLFVVTISFTLVLQVLIVEFAGKIASTTPLNWKKWIICIVIGFISWPLAAIVKFIPVPETPLLDYFSLKKSRRRHFSEHRSKSDRKDEGLNNHIEMP